MTNTELFWCALWRVGCVRVSVVAKRLARPFTSAVSVDSKLFAMPKSFVTMHMWWMRTLRPSNLHGLASPHGVDEIFDGYIVSVKLAKWLTC